jgi:hypothetical protein
METVKHINMLAAQCRRNQGEGADQTGRLWTGKNHKFKVGCGG